MLIVFQKVGARRVRRLLVPDFCEGSRNKMMMASRLGLTDAGGGGGGFLGSARWWSSKKREKCLGLMARWSQGVGLPCI